MEACNNAMKLIGEAEQEVLKMSTMAKQLGSDEQPRALEMVNSTRAEIATLKSQITQIQDQNISPDLAVTMSGHEQQTQRLADQSATAKALLGQAADQSKAGVDELKRQNEQTDNLIQQNKRIGKNTEYGIKLAEMIKCNEVKHMWLQIILLALCAALLIAAIIYSVLK